MPLYSRNTNQSTNTNSSFSPTTISTTNILTKEELKNLYFGETNKSKTDNINTTVTSKGPEKGPPKKSADKISIDDQKLQYENGAVNKEKILGQQKNKPLFIKSYYGYNFLSPYIKCFIDSKLYNETSSSLQKENYQKKFFDIPYNMLKSMDLEFEGASASGVTGKLTIKIEDGSGTVGTLLISTFYAMGSSQNIDGVPRLSIEFGWAPKGRNKLKKELENLLLSKNQYSSFLIQDIQLEFDDKYKQEITITAIQDTTGVYENTALAQSQYKPFVILGSQPTSSLRLIQYWYYFDQNKDKLQQVLKEKFSGFQTQELDGIVTIINTFLKINSNVSAININKKDFLISNSNTYQVDKGKPISNTKSFFNKLDFSKKDVSIIKTKFNKFLENSTFHPYVIFSYVLNQFVTTIKSLSKDIPIYILRYYDESKIIGFNEGVFLNNSGDTINAYDYCSRDVELGTSKISKDKEISYITKEFKVKQDDNWEQLLNRIGTFVKINSGKTNNKILTSQLYLNVRKYVKDVGDLTVDGSTGIKMGVKENLIKKFKVLLKVYEEKKNQAGVEKINGFIEFIEKQNTDFIYIIVTSGSQFLTDDNFKEKVIAQTYTVFPKITPDNRLQYQNFNSGSEDMSKESYADVIYFKPKLPFKEMLVTNLTKTEDVIYNNGAFTFKSERVGVSFLDETQKAKEENQKQLISIINKLGEFITKKEKITLTIENKNSENVFTVQGFNNIYFQHANVINRIVSKKNSSLDSSEKKDKDVIADFKTDLEGYLTTWKNGYHYSTLLNILKKNSNVFIGDGNSIDYENYIFNANEYNKHLNKMSLNFEAELKILGEPAFSYDFGQMLHVFLNVNNYDGTINVLLTGLYSVNKIKHEISESGSFTTTLTLRYDSPFTSKKDEKAETPDSKQQGVVNNG